MRRKSLKLFLAAALSAVAACAGGRGTVETGYHGYGGWHDPWWDGAYHGSYYGGDVYRGGVHSPYDYGWGYDYPTYRTRTVIRERPGVQVREHPRVDHGARDRGRVLRR